MAKKKLTLLETLEKTKEKIKELGGENPEYLTDGTLEGIANIRTDRSIDSLVKSYATIKLRKQFYSEAAAELGLEEKSLENLDNLAQDIKTRITVLKNRDRLEELKKYQDELESLISDEEKRERALLKSSSILD